MKKTLTLLVLLACMGASAQTRQLFDDGWTFTLNGKTTTVNLPHDWDIYTAPNPETGITGTGGGWYHAGKAEYTKQFATPAAEVVRLHFEGVYQHALVLVNGQKVGQHAYGYTPFSVDITPCLFKEKKRKNEVKVIVDNSRQPNCRWYSGSGIYRHVWLETMPALHIAENGVFVTTPEVSAEKATVRVDVDVQNEAATEQLAFVKMEGQLQELSLKAGERKTITFTYAISRPQLWSPDTPHLYTANVQLFNRKDAKRPLTQLSAKFGVRSFSFDAERGFVLNGKPMIINGACVHHDDGILGAMAFDAAEIRKVRQMKDAGFNLIRTSHNPTSRAFLDACDSIGMLVIGEAFDGWRTAKNPYDYSTVIDSCYQEDLRAMVERDRNHPSIICWSIGNEVIERKEIRVVTTARLMKQAILKWDQTRPVTEALCAWDRDWEIYDPHAEVLDVVGYNYMIFKHATDHQRDPKRVMWQTESFPRDAFRNWAICNDNSYVVGDMVWTGLDYLGESGIGRYYYDGERPGESYAEGGQPEWHGACCGDVDVTGWRKPISHYREMLWRSGESAMLTGSAPTECQLYMAVREPDGYRGKINGTSWSVWPTWESWNWKGWEGKLVDVEVYTKAHEVTLYLNGREIGRKTVDRSTEYKAVFQVPYEPGTLRAEANSSSVTLSTAGAPARLRLTSDKTKLTADGQDLAFVIVEVVDSQGRVCPDAAIPCQAVVKGNGQLMAFASADLKDCEPTVTPRVNTWNGRAMLVVRSNHGKGKIDVCVKSSLPTATLTIRTGL